MKAEQKKKKNRGNSRFLQYFERITNKTLFKLFHKVQEKGTILRSLGIQYYPDAKIRQILNTK